MESWLHPFHLASGLDYVASGAYRKQPSFQRFIQQRVERIRAAGGKIDCSECATTSSSGSPAAR
jgi:hypothetical protein